MLQYQTKATTTTKQSDEMQHQKTKINATKKKYLLQQQIKVTATKKNKSMV